MEISASFKEHLHLLKLVAEQGSINVQKSRFCLKSAKYLGYIVIWLGGINALYKEVLSTELRCLASKESQKRSSRCFISPSMSSNNLGRQRQSRRTSLMTLMMKKSMLSSEKTLLTMKNVFHPVELRERRYTFRR